MQTRTVRNEIRKKHGVIRKKGIPFSTSSRNNLLRVTSPANLQRTIIEGIDGKWEGRAVEAQMMCFNTDDPWLVIKSEDSVCVCVCRVCTRSSDEIPVPGITSGENVSRYLRSSRKYLTVTPKNFLDVESCIAWRDLRITRKNEGSGFTNHLEDRIFYERSNLSDSV